MSFKDLFGETLINKKGESVSVDTLEGKKVGVYFSAHWCPPCRGFTPVLADFYNDVVESGKPLEIVFVSSDRDEKSMKEYLNDMPWLAIPHGDAHAAKLKEKFSITGIPTLVILGSDGNLVTREGRAHVTNDGPRAFTKW